jgi:hypothetical protein
MFDYRSLKARDTTLEIQICMIIKKRTDRSFFGFLTMIGANESAK